MSDILLTVLLEAAKRGQVALPGELAGFVVLSILEAVKENPTGVSLRDVRLLDDGHVVWEPEEIDRLKGRIFAPRQLVGALLAVSSSISPGLKRVTVGASVSVEELVAELETALIPLNRNAARRGVARIVREILRLIALGVLDASRVSIESSTNLPTVGPTTFCPKEPTGVSPVSAAVTKDELAASVEPSLEVNPALKLHGPVRAVEPNILNLELSATRVSSEELFASKHLSDSTRTRNELASLCRDLKASSFATSKTGSEKLTSEVNVSEETRVTTLVMAPVEPNVVVESASTTLVMAPVEPNVVVESASTTDEVEYVRLSVVSVDEEPDVVTRVIAETRLSSASIEALEPSVALPLVTLRSLRDEVETSGSTAIEVSRNETNVEQVIEVSDDDVLVDEEVTNLIVAKPSNTIKLTDDESRHAVNDGLATTVIPLGAYELSYVSGASSSAPHYDCPIITDVPSTSKPSTFYRGSESEVENSSIHSDIATLAAKLDDVFYCEEPELCRRLRSLAGLELTPQPCVVTTVTPLPALTQPQKSASLYGRSG
jgi:hypothetical protein